MGQRRAVIELPTDKLAPGAARGVLSALLPAWRLAGLVEDATLIVSEMVTNAVRHAPDSASVELELLAVEDQTLRISLADGSTVKPMIRELANETPTGRGMHIVEQVAEAWGAEEHENGKRVWVELRAQPSE
jgi:anti-sigma regulatory factor (Ser/Thr protein kinase)